MTLETLFIIGSYPFWALTFIEFVLLFIWVGDELPVKTYSSIIIYLLLIRFLGDAAFIPYIKENPFNILFIFIFYILVGFVWSIGKFYFDMKNLRDKIKDLRVTWSDFSEPWKSWPDFLKSSLSYEEQSKIDFSDNKGKIIFWMSSWPISLLWTLINDPIRKFSIYIYNNYMIGIFRKIHAKLILDVLGE